MPIADWLSRTEPFAGGPCFAPRSANQIKVALVVMVLVAL